MQAVPVGVERRRFGRRESSIRGSAIVIGQPPAPFTVRDMSEGGALLVFDTLSHVPEKSFRILIDGTTFVLLCEMRHAGRAGVGVRFLRPSEGFALQRYFLLKPVEGVKGAATQLPPRPAPMLPWVRGQDLRAALDIVAIAAATASDNEAPV